ncbi:MAG: rRNA pseudouridine synthase [Bacteroidales bacterium]|nr:rRNA pseudouridine synthase [Bacteroidales bacterium]
MENNKKGNSTRRHFTRKTSESHAQRVDYSSNEYSTSRSFDSSDSPRPRRNYGDKPAYSSKNTRGEKPAYGAKSDKPAYGKSYGDKPGFGKKQGDKPGFEKKQGYGKPSFGNKPGTRKPFQKKNNAAEGMDAMLSRKPQIHGADWDGEDAAPSQIQEVVRLNKFIANSGVCSRREADTMILGGVVTVNGEVVTELGTKINVLTDDVRFNGQRLKGEEKVYIVMNKPKGYVTTASDPHAERTVMDLIKGCPRRVFPVGRLDKNTTGVLMLTNDGEMAERLTHPSFNKKKIYQVVLDHPLTDEDKEKVTTGIELGDGMIAADELEFIDERDHRQLGIEIHSGKNRIVRRIFEALGYEVKALDRVYFAGLTKKGLKKGDWRYLTEGEVNILKMGAFV